MAIENRILKTEAIAWRNLQFLQPTGFKDLPQKAHDKLKASLLNNSFAQPFFVWQDNDIIWCLDGFHRRKVMAELEAEGHKIPELLPAVFVECADKAAASKLVLLYSSIYARVSEDGLNEFLKLADLDFEALKMEIDLPDISLPKFESQFLTSSVVEDEAPDVPADPKSKLGDLYELGVHRLLCSDSTDSDAVARLMDGKKACLFATDPPYGVAYNDETGGDGDTIANDENDGPRLQSFLQDIFTSWLPFLETKSAWYLWHAQMTQGFFAAAAAAADILIHRQIIWVKPSLIMGHGDYHWQHELCFYGWRRGNRPIWYGDRAQTTVWNIGRENEHIHPTQKPVEIFSKPILFHTLKGDVVAEPFAGSGSQFIAAEQTGRVCYGMEISEAYTDVIVSRYARFMKSQGKVFTIKRNGRDVTQEFNTL